MIALTQAWHAGTSPPYLSRSADALQTIFEGGSASIDAGRGDSDPSRGAGENRRHARDHDSKNRVHQLGGR
jgi:hypothetical protein